MSCGFKWPLMALSSLLLAGPVGAATSSVEVDAREVSRGIQKVHETLAVKPGKLTLFYPKWIPAWHAPGGPIGGISGLKIVADGTTIPWRRDDVEMYAFHVTVPANVSSLSIDFEIDAVAGGHTPSATRIATDSLAVINFNELVLYPLGMKSDDFLLSAKLRLPAGWSYGTALPKTSSSNDAIQFAQTSLTTLIDSPILAGRHFRTIELGGSPSVFMHLAGDSEAAIDMKNDTIAHYRKLVQEATALTGATHYREYHFLWTLSDQIGYEGIEHHESSDNRSLERSLIDDSYPHSSGIAMLLPHEYFHSWNGKYRRPVGLATGNYDTPMRGELLWVYEGLTEYYGFVLASRSGLLSPADARDGWAGIAAILAARNGREWRPLADTAIAAPFGYDQSGAWKERTRGTDFYDESALLWLEADVLIRTKTGGAKSLDDFCKIFHGGTSAPKVRPYEFADVVKALNTVLPYDWNAFWTERLTQPQMKPPFGGLNTSGWRVVYDATQSAEQKATDGTGKQSDLSFSLGMTIGDDGGTLSDIVPGSPADLAGAAPGSHLLAVDGRKYSKDVLDDALKAGTDARSIKLLVEKDDFYNTLDLRYSGHARYPHLERDSSVPDTLTKILSPVTP